MLDILRGLFSPEGPIGALLSPAVVYKDRQGIGVASAQSARPFAQSAVRPEQIAAACAPVRVIAVQEASPPAGRVRAVSAFIEERWTPVYATSASEELSEIVAAAQTLVAWNVEQVARAPHCDCSRARFEREADGAFVHRACGRGRARLSDEQFIEQVQSVQIQASDEWANRYYETIPGHDVMIHEGKEMTGGTRITGGRAEYARKTKGFVHWDAGVVKERAAAQAASAARWTQGVRAGLEERAAKLLPHRGGL